MSFQLNLPPSEIGRLARSEQSAGDGETKKQSREDWKKMKELEEARKAGTAPAMTDEEGKDINPHIPQYIMQAPWYIGAKTPTLRHQRPQNEKQKKFDGLNVEVKKGVKEGPVARKWRKGACENCGAMGHNKKECFEPLRRRMAKYTGEKIAPDDIIPHQLNYDFEGKRDIWNGFDSVELTRQIFDDYSKLEEAKQALKEADLEEKFLRKANNEEKEGDDEDKYAEDMDMPGQKFETKQRITVRNLRIREDTAKYLFNLDLNSAHYDPKTRSMRDNPLQGSRKDAIIETQYIGDNFVRLSGDAEEFARKQLFAWEAYEKGTDVHLQADPTKLELLHKEFLQRRDTFKQTAKDSVLDRYGGHEHLEAPPKQLLLAQTEDYVEYSRHGTVIKGQEKAAVKSRYEEDVYPNNHQSVWGSFWRDGRWGYKCCHSLVKESYCTGEAGIVAEQESIDMPSHLSVEQGTVALREISTDDQPDKQEKKKKKNKDKKKKKRKHRYSSDDESDEEKKKKRLKKALEQEDAHQKRMTELLQIDERKRPYNSMCDVRAPTEDEMEAFRMKQHRSEDPMAAFLSK
ncbi:pre-mRNA-splicing factor SLU7-like isoform X1 [Pomacea canaliculata]|nr:pre-mRNA-splicing factor SLU7-like isoform X1 [Pomacea canaliculata]